MVGDVMNATLLTEQANQTTMNYAGFPALPKGTRQMLLFSEEYFFNQPAVEHRAETGFAQRVYRGVEDFMGIPLLPVRFRVEMAA
jgi:hypothetical protein